MEVIKSVAKYLNTPIGTVCYNTDKVLTTVFDPEIVEGFATIILRLVARSGIRLSLLERILTYQWLEYIAMYLNQALCNPAFAKKFLEGLNRGLRRDTFLTGATLSIADVAAYHAVYPLIEQLTTLEKESLVYVCRWLKYIQNMPNVCGNKSPLVINTLMLSILAPTPQDTFEFGRSKTVNYCGM